MRDRFGRDTTDLRISLTQRCNLRCVFCHMEGQPVATAELTPDEIERAVRAARHVGVHRVKLTGGEPTLRSDIVEIVRRLAPLVDELSMTTNGLLLDRLAGPLAEAGLRRVNVSLPSLDPAVYAELTGVDGLEAAVRGVRAAVRAGLAPVKLNVVALDGSTDGEESVARLVRFAQEVGAWVQVIEFENVRGRVDPSVYRTLHSELSRLSEAAAARAFRTSRNRLHDRPRYTFDAGGRPVTVEVVQPVENPAFCRACTRLRITSDGQLKGCLMTNVGLVDLRGPLRAGADEAELVHRFEAVIATRRPFFTDADTPVAEPGAGPDVFDPSRATPLPVMARP